MKRLFYLLACVCASLGCSQDPKDAHFIRVVVDTDLQVPADVDAFSLSVEMNGSRKFEQTYDVSVLERLPDSLIIEQPKPYFVSPDNEYTLPRFELFVTGYQASSPVVWNAAAFRYSSGQVQVALAMCFDCLNKQCPSGETCYRGACRSSWQKPPKDEAEIDTISFCGPR